MRLLIWTVADLHGIIGMEIPQIIELITDEDWRTRFGAVSILAKLTEDGELGPAGL